MLHFRVHAKADEWAVFEVEEDGCTNCINDPTVTMSLAQARELASKLKAAIMVAELMSGTLAAMPSEVEVR